jgi:hypothetical protein
MRGVASVTADRAALCFDARRIALSASVQLDDSPTPAAWSRCGPVPALHRSAVYDSGRRKTKIE